MTVRPRPMQPGDVWECVEILARDPVVAPRYGALIDQVRPAVLRLLGRGAVRAVVLEDLGGARPRLVGLGISAFVTDAYAQEVKKPPLSWIAPDLVRRTLAGEAPILTDRQLQDANTSTGLHNCTLHGCTRLEDRARPDLLNCLMTSFLEQHRGFRLSELLVQAENMEQLALILNTGGLLWNAVDQAYEPAPSEGMQGLLTKPHLLGLTRELALAQIGSWVGSLFLYQRPAFGFRPSEQRLLAAALAGGTDEELSKALMISLSAVKKTWHAIYERVAAVRPGPTTADGPDQMHLRQRGKEKKHGLLAYLREHPEELRPVSRRLLAQQAAARQAAARRRS